MTKDPIKISFENSNNPKAAIDLIRLEGILEREDLDGSQFDLQVVDFYMIILIEKGDYKHTIDFTDYSCKAGTVLTIRKGQIHKFYKNKSVRGTLLLFTDDFLVSYLEELESLKSLQLFNEILGVPKVQLDKIALLDIMQIMTTINAEYFDLRDAQSPSIIRSCIHMLIAKLFRIKSTDNSLSKNRKYLNEFVKFQELVEINATSQKKVKEYAQSMGVSSKTLNTISRAIVNKSAKTFIDEIYTKQIKRLLINTELSIKEIAYASGFDESTNFYKYFKRQTGVTPEQFRLRLS